jgi:hypothetical protein
MEETTKITRSMREATYQASIGAAILWGEETLWKCVAAGLLEVIDGDYTTTDTGHEVAQLEANRRELERRKRNRAARARSAAMRGLGMVRARTGTWE